MIVLDTNVVSEVMKTVMSSRVLGSPNSGATSDLFMTAITIEEIGFGLWSLPAGQRRLPQGADILRDSTGGSIDGSRSGGIGRRTRLKIWRVATPVGVRLPPPAPHNLDGGVDFLFFSC